MQTTTCVVAFVTEWFSIFNTFDKYQLKNGLKDWSRPLAAHIFKETVTCTREEHLPSTI